MKIMACLGDSLTQGADVAKERRWCALSANSLRITVHNHGIGGDTTAGMLARFHTEILPHHPCYVFLMGGTNDLWWGLDTDLIFANLFSLVCQARYYEIAPIIGIPLPIHEAFARQSDFSVPMGGYKNFMNRLQHFTEVLAETAAQNDVPTVDFNRMFIRQNGTVDDDLFLPDGLHPNEQGHAKMAIAATRSIKARFLFD